MSHFLVTSCGVDFASRFRPVLLVYVAVSSEKRNYTPWDVTDASRYRFDSLARSRVATMTVSLARQPMDFCRAITPAKPLSFDRRNFVSSQLRITIPIRAAPCEA